MNRPISKTNMWFRKLLNKIMPGLFRVCPVGNLHMYSEQFCYCRYDKNACVSASTETEGWHGGVYNFNTGLEEYTIEQTLNTCKGINDKILEALDNIEEKINKDSPRTKDKPIACPHCGAQIKPTSFDPEWIYFTCGNDSHTHLFGVREWECGEPKIGCYERLGKPVPQRLLDEAEKWKNIKVKAKRKKNKSKHESDIEIITMEPI